MVSNGLSDENANASCLSEPSIKTPINWKIARNYRLLLPETFIEPNPSSATSSENENLRIRQFRPTVNWLQGCNEGTHKRKNWALIRSIQRLLASAGTLESFRSLPETQLPQSIKLIIQNKSVFGYQIYSLAMDAMSTFIHSEPSSLAILQEAGLTEALYGAIDSGIEP
ncbi:hypothetical protein Pst134EA_027048 [Puccinia striiformis f. sp. tritici]|uniref:hypothetical protein n=1 Tax=Puccinia striiformis f. sp. tritici TaxID=168172 RepID=UPI002007A60B|nr:hypothetical protein Pst134EA_027048 [Puccinia striiformis f. sp. tritici]KAH9450339.1 hypothetical protein Pst134EA_027048 [Puccinia striiformis f. sp. tritici]